MRGIRAHHIATAGTSKASSPYAPAKLGLQGSADGAASAGEAAAIAEEEFCGAVHQAVVQHIDEAFDERKQRALVRRLMSQMTVTLRAWLAIGCSQWADASVRLSECREQVDPTIQIVTQHGLLPSVVQPKFVVLISKQQVGRSADYPDCSHNPKAVRPRLHPTTFIPPSVQVRVATYAFIGSPVCGDRPNRKHPARTV